MSMTEPKINVKRLFRVPKHDWPKTNRGNDIQRVQKIIKENHVTGLPTHWPKMYYGQTRANLNVTRTYRNMTVATLPDGAYLYLIEYDQKTNRYHKSFVRVLNKLEAGSRHFQLPTLKKDRFVLAAGELSKQGSKVLFNLESGTYMKGIMSQTKSYLNLKNYSTLVKNALRNARPEYTTDILVPQIPANISNLLKCGNVNFYFGAQTEKKRRELVESGFSNKSAKNLIQQLVKTCRVSPKTTLRVKNPSTNVPRYALRPRRGQSSAR